MTLREDEQGTVSLDCRLWGKEKGLPRPYPVICHLMDTAAVFLVLWQTVLGERERGRLADALGLAQEEARDVLAFWAGLHDLGKISPPFQQQVPWAFEPVRRDPAYRSAPGAEREREFRHEMATHWALARLLDDVGYPGHRLPRLAVSHQVAQLLGGHHGRFGAVLSMKELKAPSVYRKGLGEEGWDQQRRAHFDELRRVVGAEAVPKSGLPSDLAVIVAGLVVVADWLCSPVEPITALLPPEGWRGTPSDLDAHWQRTRQSAERLVRQARLGRVRFEAQRFQEMFEFTPNPLQSDLVDKLPSLVAERGPGLLLVTAPTGDGKTEAALFAASVMGRAADARGLYFALPTMATADAMYPRVASFAKTALGGERALRLLHSMAWLSTVAATTEQLTDETEGQQLSADLGTALEAGTWLHGAKRGLLAQLGVGTIDQALCGVLPLTHNALRLFGLSDKVFVLDEAHAYGPWMQALLSCLLEWLGAFRVPVVLLSATLTGRTASSLVDAYRRGLGVFEASAVEPCYPGWLFVDAGTGSVSGPYSVGTERTRTIEVTTRPVFWDTEAEATAPVRGGGRREALRELLAPVAERGGTALVCCTTVAEAQRTFRDLREAFPALARSDGGLRLLHSRYQARVRQRITEECEAAYGKPGKEQGDPGVRPASVLVATQVVEQSLDLDFDLVVSDLAPLAQLLQRAGRCRRHRRGANGRPEWALPEDRPSLVVLEPLDDRGQLSKPRSWGSVYFEDLLHRTSKILGELEGGDIHVPRDVQRLVDAVYAEDFVERVDDAVRREYQQMETERLAQESAERVQADVVRITSPADVAGNLHQLSHQDPGVTDELLTTRLGADSGRVLCLYEQADGAVTLDEEGEVVFRPEDVRVPSRAQLAQMLSFAVPVPGTWLVGGDEGFERPDGWRRKAVLRDLTVLRMRRDEDGGWSCVHGERTIRSTPEGLETG